MSHLSYKFFIKKIINKLIIFVQLLITLIFYLSSSQTGFALHSQDPEFLSVAIFRLTEQIRWPNAKQIKKYHIHVIDESPNVEIELKRISTIRKLHNRPVQISRSHNATIPPDTHVIYVSNHNSKLLPNILNNTLGSSILVISYDGQNQRIVMINFKSGAKDKSKIRFEINKANIINRGMSISPDIILLGGTEIDVANLYKSSQDELLKKERKINLIEKKIQQINNEKKLTKQSLTKLTKTLEKQKQSYKKLEKETQAQQIKINKQATELKAREKYLDKQSIEIDKRSTILKQQQTNIDIQSNTIKKQKNTIRTQEKTLKQSNATIESQKNYLTTLSILSTLVALGAILAFWLYRKNQHINAKLLVALNSSKQNAYRLEMANEQLQSFSYTVSHDLKAPLRSITGFSEILIEDYGNDLNDDIKNYLNRIVENIKRMSGLITDILMLSKLSQSEVNYINNVNLSDIVLKELELLNQSGPRELMELDIQQNVLCQCDPKLIKILLANIIGNAWKYTPNTQSAKFEFGSKTIDTNTVYFFKDNGVGFNMDYAKKLFEPFQRLHSDKQFEGTGIGLATVKRIINLHHGTIWAESEVGTGSIFYFTLNTN